MTTYDRNFYEIHLEAARRSAAIVIPALQELIGPKSVVDVGCGSGAWLSAFQDNGVTDVLGIDGDWVDRNLLQIPESCFRTRDLTRPFQIERTFDLAMSLEVAEHLPSGNAEQFIQLLTSLGPVVLFSAAIPQQGGRNHVNEQWPDYWARLFSHRGFLPFDCLRSRFWNNTGVEWFYSQNLFLFVDQNRLKHYVALQKLAKPDLSPLPLVHPRLLHEKLKWIGEVEQLAEDLSSTIPVGAPIMVIDQGSLGRLATAGYRVIPFSPPGTPYSSPPIDDDAAVSTFQALVDRVDFVVIAWPAFWWLDHYPKFADRVLSNFARILDNSRAVVFDTRGYRNCHKSV